MYEELQGQVLKTGETRAWRTYIGGKRIDEWHGRPGTSDDNFPEDWIASTVRANNVGREDVIEGLSRVENHSNKPYLRDVLENVSESFFGREHLRKFGAQPGFLSKIIDAAERLTIQVHPDKEYAREIFRSDYGKTESWYILNDSPGACIYFGFKPGITKRKWQEIFRSQDIPSMLDCLHQIPVKRGDCYFISGGLPHAIGKDCFLIELQEPTDLTMRTELITPSGLRIGEMQCHQGVGYEKMMDCFHYEGCSLEEIQSRWRVTPQTIAEGDGYRIESLIDDRYTKLFSMRTIFTDRTVVVPTQSRYTTMTVISGAGVLRTKEKEILVKQGESFVVPAAVREVVLDASEGMLHAVQCAPPSLEE